MNQKDMEILVIQVENPDELNFILGQSHFIKTVEDIQEALVQTVPGIRFGLAFCEASGPCLIRHAGNEDGLIELAIRNAEKIGAGHSFILFLKKAFPINVLPVLRHIPEICGFFCATANPTQVLVARTAQGSGILGVIDGRSPAGVEQEDDIRHRKAFLRTLGYKQGT